MRTGYKLETADIFIGFHESEEPIPSYLSTGMKVLAETLQLWLKTDGPVSRFGAMCSGVCESFFGF